MILYFLKIIIEVIFLTAKFYEVWHRAAHIFIVAPKRRFHRPEKRHGNV